MHKNRQNEIARTAQQTGARTSQIGNSGRTEAGLVHDVFGGMGRDYRNEGSSFLDKVGNRIASLAGFNEQAPTKQAALDRVRGTANPTQNGLDNRAGWGFDPVGVLSGLGGMALGVPGLGLVGDYISQQMGRPLEISMGPDVFGLDSTGTSPTAPGGLPGDGTAASGTVSPLAARSMSYLSGRTVKPTSGSPTSSTDQTGSVPGTQAGDVPSDVPGGSTADQFEGPASAVAASRSPFNSGIGGLSGGGFAMGRTRGGKRSSSPKSLAEGLGRYSGPYDKPATVL
jgi:hypothetical protein